MRARPADSSFVTRCITGSITPSSNDIILRVFAIIMIVARGPDKETRAYNGKDPHVEYISLGFYSFPESLA